MTPSSPPTETRRRRRYVTVAAYAATMLVIAAAIVLLVAFQRSWLAEKSPVASAQQQYHGQSVFTAAGRRYSDMTALVTIDLAPNRATASELGLPSSGETTATYSTPLTVAVSADSNGAAGGNGVRLQLVQGVDIVTSHGQIVEVLFATEQAYDVQYDNASAVIASVGTTDDQSAFDAALQKTKAASARQSYSAVEVLGGAGMSTRVELSGTQNLAKLAIRVTPAR